MSVARSATVFVLAILLSKTNALSLDPSQRLQRLEAQPIHVWVTAFARSSSSTVQSLVEAAAVGSAGFDPQSDLFSLFEPCHPLDEVDDPRYHASCHRFLAQLMKCNFSGVESLHGWEHDHSVTGGGAYSQESAESRCRQAKFVLMKTVNVTNVRPDGVDRRGSAPVPYPLDLRGMREYLLAQVPNLRIINVVRDPRATYASMMETPAFELVIARDPATLRSMCDSILANLNVHHPLVLHMRYESFVTHPHRSARRVTKFLGIPFGSSLSEWINTTFSTECVPQKDVSYDDCHTDPEASITKWEDVLTPLEMEVFESHPACCEIAQRRKYPLGKCHVTEHKEHVNRFVKQWRKIVRKN